jgi:VWFA-related protein
MLARLKGVEIITIPSRRDVLRLAALASTAGPTRRLLAWQEAPSEPKYSSNVKVVNVFANVHDKGGTVVSTLAKGDFSIEEDGRPQVIQYFARQTDLPLTLGLLVDTSGSGLIQRVPLRPEFLVGAVCDLCRVILGPLADASERNKTESERGASYQFFHQVVREGTDKAFLIHFDRQQVELLQDLTSSKTELVRGLHDLTGDNGQSNRRNPGQGRGVGPTLYDAVLLASDELMRKQEGRKAMILFSDGEDNGSKVTLSRAIESAQRADTLVYSVRFYYDQNAAYGRRRSPPGYPVADGKKVMQQLSSETGGAYFQLFSGGMTLDKIYARIQDDLRNQYSLGYTSDQTGGGYRKIKVTAKGKNLTVQAREGYYAR